LQSQKEKLRRDLDEKPGWLRLWGAPALRVFGLEAVMERLGGDSSAEEARRRPPARGGGG
jgi:hypothetical protein